jgi:acetyltransferase-like isoleucine patch superfamily enzyme
MLKSSCKAVLNALALASAWPCALTVWLEGWLNPRREDAFVFWAQALSLAPGMPGMYLRRAFYAWTLEMCALDSCVGFGAIFSNRQAVVESRVYIGPYALIGSVRLRRGCLIGSRASLLSGGRLHAQSASGDWLPTDPALREQIEIGENAWLGEGAIVMADIGPRAMVAAGAVVSTPVPERVMVAGNPTRFVKRLSAGDSSAEIAVSRPQPVAVEA